MTAFETAPGNWSTTLEGRDVGDRHDLQIADFGSGAAALDITGMGWDAGSETFDGFGPSDFTELQDAADAPWVGAEIRTQSTAQLSLDAVDRAIEMKTSMESVLGAMQNRLENTVTQLGLQSDALQTAEAKISDVDYARETTEYTKNLVLAEAATAILAQANSLPELALTLLET
jgi:flagellin